MEARKKLVMVFGNMDIAALHEVITGAVSLDAAVQLVDSDQVSEFDGKDAVLFLNLPVDSIPSFLDYGDQMVGSGRYDLSAILCTPEIAEDSPEYNAQVQTWAEPILARIGEGGTWADGETHDTHHLTGDLDIVAEKLCEALGTLFATTATPEPEEVESDDDATPAPASAPAPVPSKDDSAGVYAGLLAKAKAAKGKVDVKTEKPKAEIKPPAPKVAAPAPKVQAPKVEPSAPKAPAAAPKAPAVTPKPAPASALKAAAPVAAKPATAAEPVGPTPGPTPRLGSRAKAEAPATMPVGPEVNLTIKMGMNGALVPVNIVVNVAELKKALGL